MYRLEKLYSTEGMFLDKNEDGLFDGLNGKIVLSNKASQVEKITALNILARMAHECVAISTNNISFANSSKNEDSNVKIIIDKQASDICENETSIEMVNKNLMITSKNEKTLEKTGAYVYSRFPYIWDIDSDFGKLEDVLEYFRISICSDLWIKKIIVNSEYQGLSKVFINIKTNDEEKYERDIIRLLDISKFSKVEQIFIDINGNKKIISKNEHFEKIEYNTLKYNDFDDSRYNILDLFSPKGLYKSSNVEFMPDTMNVSLALPEKASNGLVTAAGNIISRLAIDCLELKLPLVSTFNQDRDYKNTLLISELDESNEAQLFLDEDNNNVILKGNNSELNKLSQEIAKIYPYIDKEKNITLEQLTEMITGVVNCKNAEGQLIHAKKHIEESVNPNEIKLYLDNSKNINDKGVIKKIEDKYSAKNVEILDYKEEEIVWKKSKEFNWEANTFKNIIVKELYPLIKEDDEVRVLGYISEDSGVRKNITNDIVNELIEKNVKKIDCEIYSSYKQGYSWINDKIIPYINNNINTDTIEKIVINFKPFLPEGITEWSDEDGATPKLDAERENDEGKWFDLPIRFLQELYPIDDIIARELKIDREKIVFKDNKEIENTYEISCYSKDEKLLFTEEFEVKTFERPYLDEYPKIAKVHPTTGWIRAYINGKLLIDKRIKTDLENIWDYYQSEILSSTKDYIHNITNGEIKAELQPFFKQLKIEIEASEPDYKIPTRKDLISSLDSLHEDIYFVGLDFFKTLGMRTSGEITNEPGLVLPLIKKVEGANPKIKTTLIKEKFKTSVLFLDNNEIKLEHKKFNNLKVYKIKQNEDITTICYKIVNKETYELLIQYCNYVKSGLFYNPVKNLLYNISFDLFENEELIDSVFISKEINIKAHKKMCIDNDKVKTDELIGYDDYIKIMKYLEKVKGLKTYPISKSYQGRDIYAIEMVDYDINEIVSRYKLINSKPVYYINSRHHANEVSSTNAAFDLVKLLLNDDDYKEYLKKLNIVIIPFENVDGGYIHYELQKQNPEWKLHIARYNSVGKEFAYDYFNPNTKYGEALAYTRTWYKWLPDIIVDNHGVPSHEWDQQFSGYVSPWFKGFWLPRALYYGYFWYLKQDKYKENREISAGIQDAVADYINEDKEMTMWNQDWKDRFEKYANKWMPKLFPAEYYKNLIFYWIPYEQNDRGYHASHKYPNITCMDWTTEVSDETAQGEYLRLCSKAHLKASLATMKYMNTLDARPKILNVEDEGLVKLRKIRNRPLSI